MQQDGGWGHATIMSALKCRTLGATRFQYSWSLIIRMRAFHRKNGRLYIWPSKEAVLDLRNRAVSEKTPENPTNVLTSVAHWVRNSIFKTNGRSRGEMWLNRHTDRQTKYCNPRCVCTSRFNNMPYISMAVTHVIIVACPHPLSCCTFTALIPCLYIALIPCLAAYILHLFLYFLAL